MRFLCLFVLLAVFLSQTCLFVNLRYNSDHSVSQILQKQQDVLQLAGSIQEMDDNFFLRHRQFNREVTELELLIEAKTSKEGAFSESAVLLNAVEKSIPATVNMYNFLHGYNIDEY